MGGVRILRNRKLGFSRLQGFLRTFNYSRQTHLRVMHLFFCGLKNNKFFEQVTKAENINCQKLAGIDFCQNLFLTLSAKAMSNYNKICQHNGYIRQFCSFDKFYPDSNKRLSVLPVVCEVPLPGMNELNFLPLCAPTHCPSHTLRPNILSVACFTIVLVLTIMFCSAQIGFTTT